MIQGDQFLFSFFFFFTKTNVPQNFENFVSSNQFQLYANEIVRKTQFLFVLQFFEAELRGTSGQNTVGE